MHEFYIPRGLWNTKVKNLPSVDATSTLRTRSVKISSEMYKLKDAWLVSMGRKKASSGKKGPKRKLAKVPSDSEDEKSDSDSDLMNELAHTSLDPNNVAEI